MQAGGGAGFKGQANGQALVSRTILAGCNRPPGSIPGLPFCWFQRSNRNCNPERKMSRFFKDYHAASGYARREATRLQLWYGIRNAQEYGSKGYRVSMIPADPNKRFGDDYRAEAVGPNQPLSQAEADALSRLGAAI
jgi:hypothetical protein